MNFLQKLFSREVSEVEETKPSMPEAASERRRPVMLASVTTGCAVGKGSDIGQARERNEDSFLVIEASMQNDSGPMTPLGLYIVADGMGGHQKGEVASSLAAQTTARHIIQDVFLPFLSGGKDNAQRRPINEALIEAVEAANAAVHQAVPEAGTTLTFALVLGHNAYLAHVGDSRAYVLKQGKLQQVTQDHSLVARLVELGQATPEEALTHAHRNVLYRAVGQAGSLEVDTYLQMLPPNSCLLLCSDGLWGMISDEKIENILMNAPTPQSAVDQLIAAANQSGGDDNITAVLVAIGSS